MKTLVCGWLGCFSLAIYWGTISSVRADEIVSGRPDPQGIEFFEKHIRPVLTQQCYKCHAQDSTKIKGELLLDTREGALKGGQSGPAVVPGNVDESLIISALKHDQFEMPPGNKLPDDVIANFEHWIKIGAPDPRDGKTVIFGKRDINIEEGRKFWAFQPPRKVAPQKTKNSSWARTDIDRYVLTGLEAHNLSPVVDASPRELVRRLYFDVIGLPPTAQEIELWTSRLSTDNGDIDQASLSLLVDELLASPRFGERWGRHWLDLARYADSNGNVDNTPFPEAWRYRNWVIDALNADLPYDSFISAQLAGDLLPYDSPSVRNQNLIATGFLAIGSKPRAQNNPNFEMDVVAEQIEVATTAMLGLTVACARCHDHKFDPIPTSDYYALAGIFSSSRTLYGTGVRGNNKKQPTGGGLITLVADHSAADRLSVQQIKRHEELIVKRNEVVAELRDLGASDAEVNKEKKNNQKANPQKLKKLQARLKKARDQGDENKIRQLGKEIASLSDAPPSSSDAKNNNDKNSNQGQIKTLRNELVNIAGELAALKLPDAGQAMGVTEGRPADCAICIAGESSDRGPIASRGFVSVATIGTAPLIASDQSGRLQLAQWIASKNHPLTARVMVNRVWQHLLGSGIVKTVDNFGELGDRPTHPELLDYLALQFMQDGWSVKQLIRTIVLTRTYQLSSMHDAHDYSIDPENTWLWRVNSRRLDAESFRDAILAFSGKLELNRPAGGTTIPEFNKKEAPKSPSIGTVRSVYLPIVRNGEPEALMLFDFADPSIVVGQREETTVPSQSLYLLNSSFVVAQSRAAAERFFSNEAASISDVERVDLAYLAAFGRRPTDEQRTRALAYLNSERQSGSTLASWMTFCQSLIAAAEFRYLD